MHWTLNTVLDIEGTRKSMNCLKVIREKGLGDVVLAVCVQRDELTVYVV